MSNALKRKGIGFELRLCGYWLTRSPATSCWVEQVDRLSRLTSADWEKLKAELTLRRVRVVALDLPTSWMMATANADEFTGRLFEAINGMLLDVLAAVARKDCPNAGESLSAMTRASVSGTLPAAPPTKSRWSGWRGGRRHGRCGRRPWTRNPECRYWLNHRRKPPFSRTNGRSWSANLFPRKSKSTSARSRRISVRSHQQQTLYHRVPQPPRCTGA